MEIDDSDFPIVRKNLNIISVLIMILAYANAKLNTLSFLGIQIDLDAHKMYVAIFILYSYFIWRFLTKLPFRSGFLNDFHKYYLDSDEGVRKEHNFNRYKEFFLAKKTKLKDAIQKNQPPLLTSVVVHRFQGKPLTELRLVLSFQTTNEFGDNGSSHINTHHDFKSSNFLVARKLLVFCFKYDKFGDYLFPIVPIVINLVFFFFSSQWQGGLRNL